MSIKVNGFEILEPTKEFQENFEEIMHKIRKSSDGEDLIDEKKKEQRKLRMQRAQMTSIRIVDAIIDTSNAENIDETLIKYVSYYAIIPIIESLVPNDRLGFEYFTPGLTEEQFDDKISKTNADMIIFELRLNYMVDTLNHQTIEDILSDKETELYSLMKHFRCIEERTNNEGAVELWSNIFKSLINQELKELREGGSE